MTIEKTTTATEEILVFYFRGERYEVDRHGRIRANGLKAFSNDWFFLGGSSHHWHRHITVSLNDAFNLPGLLDGCLGWDEDYGTKRQWGGQYYGKLPRIERAHLEQLQKVR